MKGRGRRKSKGRGTKREREGGERVGEEVYMMTFSQPLPHTGLNYIGSLHYTQTLLGSLINTEI